MTPIVSVCMITYNHERYIGQAIESVVSQRTNFSFDLNIGEDCSTDNTQSIIKKYQKTNPTIVKPIFRKKNIGMKPNFIDVMSKCTGKYIALLEGDDYWTDPYKLQKQVDFLEENKEYVMVGANALCIFEEENYSKSYLINDSVYSFDVDTGYLIVHNPYPTLTVMFKNNLVTEFPEVYFQSLGGDRRLYILLSIYGKGRYINDVVGVYRVHCLGVTNEIRKSVKGKINILEEQMSVNEMWNDYLGNDFKKEVEIVRKRNAKQIVRLTLNRLDLRKAMQYSQYLDYKDFRRLSAKASLLFLHFLHNFISSLNYKVFIK